MYIAIHYRYSQRQQGRKWYARTNEMTMQAYSHMGHECIIIVYVSCVIHVVLNCIPIYVCLCNMLLMRAASLGSSSVGV